MRFSTISAVLAFAATACAQTAGFDAITAPTQDQNVAAGSTLDIIWEPTATYNNDTITFTLLEGSTPSTLALGPVVASNIPNTPGKFSWAIPSSIASFATYGFQITLDSNSKIFQYSFPFHITGTSGSSSTSASGSVTASTKTLTLSTGTAYTATSTYTSTANSSSSINTYPASTLSTAASITPTGNSTLSFITPSATATTTKSKTTTGSATTSSGPASATTNAAIANIASGSFALFGGLALALAL